MRLVSCRNDEIEGKEPNETKDAGITEDKHCQVPKKTSGHGRQTGGSHYKQ